MLLTNKEAISLAQTAYFNFTIQEIAEFMERQNQLPTVPPGK